MKRITQVMTAWAFHWMGGIGSCRLQARNDLHLARKLWHSIMGSVIVAVYLFAGLTRWESVAILGSVFVLDLVLETLRLRNPRVNQWILKAWAPFMRQCEVSRISGIPYYVGASALAIAVFPKEIAALSILFLAWGDPVASLFGILFGDRSVRFSNGKSLIGTLAGVATCMLVATLFLAGYPFAAHEYLLLVLIAGAVGGTAELLPIQVDDNFSIPVVSGFALWLGYLALGITV